MSRVISIEVRNVKRINAVRMEFGDDNLLVVGGNNGHGKTSLLDSLWYCLAGKKAFPSKLVRDGEEEALVQIETEDLIIRRVETAEGRGSLVVTSRDGKRLPRPQAILDKLLGSLTFDPMAFMRLSEKEQARQVREVVGLDTTVLEKRREVLYDSRTVEGREVIRLTGYIDTLVDTIGLPADEISISGLMSSLKEMTEKNEAAAGAQTDNDVICSRMDTGREHIVRLERQLVEARELMGKLEEERLVSVVALDNNQPVDTTDLEGQITDAEETNKLVRANHEITRATVEKKAAEERVVEISQNIGSIDAEIKALLEAAIFPVEGLAFGDDMLTYNGIPFKQASSAEHLRISTAMGLALTPDLRLMLVREGSLLDDTGLALLAKLAKEMDGQILLEKVGKDKVCSVIIEDGMIEGEEVE